MQIKYNDDALKKLRQRKIILGEMAGKITGYPSIDMPWLKYYTEEQIISSIPNMSAYDYLKILNTNNLKLTAIEFLGQKITYKELFKTINKVAKSLNSIGVKKGDIVTIILPACPEEVYLLYALDQIGACANFIFPGTSLLEIKNTVDMLNSKYLFIFNDLIESNSLSNIFKDINVVIISLPNNESNLSKQNFNTWNKFIENGKDCEISLCKYNESQEQPLFIAKTGGSTGKPKLVMLGDRSFNLLVHQHLNSSLGYGVGDRWLRLWPLFSATAAISSCHLPLCAGMTLVLEPTLDIDKMDEIILRTRPSHMPLVTSCMDSLINSKLLDNVDLSFIKTIGCGGESMTPEFEKKAIDFSVAHNINSYLGNGYGLTENGTGAVARISKETSVFGGSGVPMLNNVLGVFNPDTNEELKYNQQGEICIMSSTFMIGYYNDIDLTNSVIRKHPDGRVWLHTGDLGYIDENGQVFIKGRIKRVISIYTGNKIYPLDIESKLEKLEGIEKIAIVAEEDEFHHGYMKPCCCVVINEKASKEEIKTKIVNICKAEFPQYINLDNIYFLQNMPHNAIGKIDVVRLEEDILRLKMKKDLE